jgi:hypothetical protein
MMFRFFETRALVLNFRSGYEVRLSLPTIVICLRLSLSFVNYWGIQIDVYPPCDTNVAFTH